MDEGRRRLEGVLVVVAILIALTAADLLAHYSHAPISYFVVPATALLLVATARVAGLTWTDLGLSRKQLSNGIAYALAAIIVVGAIVSVAVAVPASRDFFMSDRYADPSDALFAAFIVIPLQTVIPEELIFRGVLQGTLMRFFATRVALTIGAVAFGLWHLTSSLGLTAGNEGLSDTLGSGTFGQIAGVVGAVVATTLAGFAFGWLRMRSDSLLAPVALHWALNATGAIGVAVAWHLG
ncbi:CPBP family intramembrane glutamic endopeptidase [Gordonia sp. ABSL49_1]|uniref:CPBP family intramembrane glutamic endopeptidase n=1 Tax=unclassified Gordonia (in: high G+C Gram-positive bacteria) TaxID=2657482 RepID=UPI001F0D74E0|nr:CPBP family intramembrane glutamic endopeptidase [Gordonia sp. ABSL49_1]MCH5643847.1 CPBP family intramembrane metalloprotease [Gordonia sp. ABSL49_1]